MIRKILIPLAVLLLTLAGCSSNAPTPEVTVTETVTATPTSDENMPSEDEKYDDLYALWASDVNREVLFQDYPAAGLIVAQALIDGQFGPVFKYNEWKTAWTPGQTGWGGISANAGGDATYNKPGAFAWVWWNADGTVDWSMGVPDFSIDMGPEHVGVMYFSNFMFDENIEHSVILDAAAYDGKTTYHQWFDDCPPADSDYLMYTRSVTDLIRLETNAMKALSANMAALTGDRNWMNQG